MNYFRSGRYGSGTAVYILVYCFTRSNFDASNFNRQVLPKLWPFIILTKCLTQRSDKQSRNLIFCSLLVCKCVEDFLLAEGKIDVPLRGHDTFITHAAHLWNRSDLLRAATTKAEATAIAFKLSLDVP
jgi:hypothetical protein